MIKFTRIEINNFYSIQKIDLDIKSGLHFVQGRNLDISTVESVSNGAGKTSLFNAIFQNLYNKNLKDVDSGVMSVVNLYTAGESCIITLFFTIDKDKYKVVNSRGHTSSIEVFKNGVIVPTKGVVNNLVYLRNLIGLDFNSFTALTFLNQKSLFSIIDMTNRENILYQVFQLEKLNSVHKHITIRVKEIKNTETLLLERVSNADNSIALLSDFSYTSTVSLLQRKQQYLDHQADLKRVCIPEIDKNYDILHTMKNIIITDKQNISIHKVKLAHYKKELEALKAGVCPTCGSDTKALWKSKEKEYNKYNSSLSELITQYNKLVKQYKKLDENTALLKDDFEIKNKHFKDKITQIVLDITELETKNALYNDATQKKDTILRDKEKNIKELNDLNIEKEYLMGVSKAIKSGKILSSYLEKYKKLFDYNMKEYKKLTSFNFTIVTSVKKGQIVYKFIDGSHTKSYSALSSGEMTRASLLILLATLKTLEQLLNIKINYLVFDELFGVLDKEGLSFVQKVIAKLKKEKAIYVVNHHDELDMGEADSVYMVEKFNNLTTLKEAS